MVDRSRWWEAQKYAIENDPKNILSKALGQGIGTGLRSGYQSAMNQVVEQRKSRQDMVNKLFDNYMPVRANPNATGVNDKYIPVPIQEYPRLADGMMTNKNIPQDIFFVNKNFKETKEPETVSIMASNDNIPTLKKYMPGYQWTTGVSIDVPKTVYQSFQSSLKSEYNPQANNSNTDSTIKKDKATQDAISDIEKRASSSANNFIRQSQQDKLYGWDKLNSDERSKITQLAKDLARLQEYKVSGKTPSDYNDTVTRISRAYQYLKNAGKTPTWAQDQINTVVNQQQAQPIVKQATSQVQSPTKTQYKKGDIIDTPKGKVRVTGIDKDGHPLVERI